MTSIEVDTYISSKPEWQQANLLLFRHAISRSGVPATETIKWNVPVFVVDGKALFAMSAFVAHTKYNFFTGASLRNQSLFNNGLDSKQSRGIDLRKGETIDELALLDTIREAAGLS